MRLTLFCMLTLTAAVAGAVDLNVRDFGAVGDGAEVDTAALQRALDACYAAGGGTVRLPRGTYLTGTLFLRSHVILDLAADAILLGSTDLVDYPVTAPAFRSYTDNYTNKSILYGENIEGVGLSGKGVIDGQGAAFPGEYQRRPFMLRLIQCRDVSVDGLTFRNGAMWTVHFLACDDVVVNDVTIRSRSNKNNDGFDIDCSQRVRLSNCDVSSGDDAIVLKSTADRPCRDVEISNCRLSTDSNALKMGTESNGGFENIVIRDCRVYDTHLAGIALEIVDGGRMNDILIENITMDGVGAPIFVRLGNRARPFRKNMAAPGIGTLGNVRIAGVKAIGAGRVGCAISGIPGHYIEDLRIEDVDLQFAGGAPARRSLRKIPEREDEYPEFKMFGLLPAYGLYCRHVRGLHLEDIRLSAVEDDGRPAVVADEAEGLTIHNLNVQGRADQPAAVWLRNVRGAALSKLDASPKSPVFVRVDGADSQSIWIENVSPTAADAILLCEEEVAAGAVGIDAGTE